MKTWWIKLCPYIIALVIILTALPEIYDLIDTNGGVQALLTAIVLIALGNAMAIAEIGVELEKWRNENEKRH